MQSCPTVAEAIRLAKQVKEIQKAANFSLHKWTPNSREILEEFGDTSKDGSKKLYDPLGLVAFQAVIGRLIMRELWKLECEWDEQLPNHLNEQWQDWTSKLHKLEELELSRWCGLKQSKRELHIFVDASERAMAAVIHKRNLTGKRHRIDCRLEMQTSSP